MSYRLFDKSEEKVLLPEDDPEKDASGYGSLEYLFETYQENYGENIGRALEQDELEVQELERIGWVDMSKLDSKREIIEELSRNPFREYR